ncbi:hypothetical protein LOCC1_G005253 [Lachnellula occidentalis]|uniref:Uncharacterized protein n=1 Tax=Lachnellula occidentalis TaxID=215460 RepID=A0A8H8RTW9_9HELO|nr:hypothetical protein LOCC1_G005253 [Lachnellula occidentalis]
MSTAPLSRIIALTSALTISTVLGSTYYIHAKLNESYEDNEARHDETERTLRGHVGLIEDALDRLEAKVGTKGGKGEDKAGKLGMEKKDARGGSGPVMIGVSTLSEGQFQALTKSRKTAKLPLNIKH